MFAQVDTTGGEAAGGIFFYLVILALVVLEIAGLWKVFEKAGKPGWAAIVPIYNLIVILQIIKRPIWWIVLFIIPFVNIVVAIIAYIDLAKAFDKDALYGIALLILGFIFLPMLGWGEAQYDESRLSRH